MHAPGAEGVQLCICFNVEALSSCGLQRGCRYTLETVVLLVLQFARFGAIAMNNNNSNLCYSVSTYMSP